jgi:uncharacterized protein YcfJ
MKSLLRTTLALAAVALALPATAQLTFYEREGFEGRTFSTDRQVDNFERYGFNDRASSVVVQRGRWEVCEDMRLQGRCVVLRQGSYPSLSSMGLNDRVSSVRSVRGNVRADDPRFAPAPVAAQVTFYEHEGFRGRTFTTERPVADFDRYGFNDRASSAMVMGDRWEVCQDTRFSGRCVVLRPGSYASLAAMGLNDRASSVRTVRAGQRFDDQRYAPAPMPVYDSRRRGGERVYQADVTSVRAVMGTPEQRCWVEREQVVQDRGGSNVPAAVLGAVLGGVIGHQIGGGRGQDIATAPPAVAGAAVGANVGRGGGQQTTRDVQRCTSTPAQTRPDYWDVTYNFRGQEHRMQMTTPPGATVAVNERGEPRT